VSYEFPTFVAPIGTAQIVEALEELERESGNRMTVRYVEALRLAIERTELLRASENKKEAR
jgi:hypothetical protein